MKTKIWTVVTNTGKQANLESKLIPASSGPVYLQARRRHQALRPQLLRREHTLGCTWGRMRSRSSVRQFQVIPTLIFTHFVSVRKDVQ